MFLIMTGNKLTKKERERRQAANARRLELQRDRRRRGICGCGNSTSSNPRTGKRYACCDKCREFARRSYQGKRPVVLKEAKLDLRLKNLTGVRRRLERDGMGREAWWWFATANFGGKPRTRRWAVTAHGDREARRLAIAQREEWER